MLVRITVKVLCKKNKNEHMIPVYEAVLWLSLAHLLDIKWS